MANIKSQIKRNRQNEKARLRNKSVKSSLKTVIRKLNEASEAGNSEAATALLRDASRKLDKAVSKGVIHKNQAANRKAAMLLWQAAGTAFQAQGMKPEEYGVAPVPFLADPPAGSKRVNSMVAGINIAVFRHSRNLEGAMNFVKFMTSDEEQITLNKTYGSLPSVTTAAGDTAFQATEQKALAQVLGSTAAPLPQVATESQFETLVGTAMKDLFADAASGKAITDAAIHQKLADAQEQIKG